MHRVLLAFSAACLFFGCASQGGFQAPAIRGRAHFTVKRESAESDSVNVEVSYDPSGLTSQDAPLRVDARVDMVSFAGELTDIPKLKDGKHAWTALTYSLADKRWKATLPATVDEVLWIQLRADNLDGTTYGARTSVFDLEKNASLLETR